MNLNNLGATYYRLGEHQQSVHYQHRCIERFHSVGETWGMAMARLDLQAALIEDGATPSTELPRPAP